MSLLQEVVTTPLGWPQVGPVEQWPGRSPRAAIVLGGRTVWFDDQRELLALLNCVSHQLSRLQELDRAAQHGRHGRHAQLSDLVRPFIPPAAPDEPEQAEPPQAERTYLAEAIASAGRAVVPDPQKAAAR